MLSNPTDNDKTFIVSGIPLFMHTLRFTEDPNSVAPDQGLLFNRHRMIKVHTEGALCCGRGDPEHLDEYFKVPKLKT
jgi:hypothetical protein